MRKIWLVCICAVSVGALFFMVPAFAQDDEDACGCEACGCEEGCDEGCGCEEGKDEGMAGQMPPWMMPTKANKDLLEMEGTWDVASKSWEQPGKPPEESKGVSVAKAILNGNFVEQTYKGSYKGMPFEGRLLLGYDTLDKEYVAIWIDTWSPLFSISRGSEQDGMIVYKTHDPDYSDPTGRRKEGKMTVRWGNADTYTVSFYMTAGGKEVKHMELAYTRRK